MRNYELCVARVVRVWLFVVVALITFVAPVVFLRSGAPLFVLVFLLGMAAWQWWLLLTLPYRIVVHDDGAIEWVALLRRIKMLPEEVREIRPLRGGHIGFFVAIHSGGKVRFINQITGFHEVLLHIKTRNPQVILKGC
jgi:hypothetical protein